MNRIIKNSIFFVLLIFLQIFVFNNFSVWGYINPMPYILFVLLFPIQKSKELYLVIGFIFGFIIDFFSNSGGIHASATLLICYIRLPMLKFFLRKKEIDILSLQFYKVSMISLFYYTAILILIHHLTIFSLEFFAFSKIMGILKYTLMTSILTFIICVTSLYLFVKNK